MSTNGLGDEIVEDFEDHRIHEAPTYRTTEGKRLSRISSLICVGLTGLTLYGMGSIGGTSHQKAEERPLSVQTYFQTEVYSQNKAENRPKAPISGELAVASLENKVLANVVK